MDHHVEFLLGSSTDSLPTVDAWLSFRSDDLNEHAEDLEAEIVEPYHSVTSLYAAKNGYSDSPLLGQILSKSQLDLGRLHSILASPQTNDEISEHLADVCGYGDMELIVDILSSRSSIGQELKEHLARIVEDPFAEENARQRLAQTLRENAARPLYSHPAASGNEQLPHVYTSTSLTQGNILSATGSKYILPVGTERRIDEEDRYEEVVVPPAKTVPPRATERTIKISELDPLARGSFPGYSSLNRVQSIVYQTAYLTNENMLVCAPTGAGKTDVAVLTILRVLNQHRSNIHDANTSLASTINRATFKIIYVAPMKALASEIVQKLGKRLKWLSIQVRELTGDMQMSKAEIAQTQIIVTTPEKWDVVTRKPTGEGDLVSTLRLLIIDEVHLLNEDRGAVIEAIVARTLRQAESSQSVIRIVGLSATLPNYVDVAEFLSASKQKGLFYFDSSFRPVPLEQHFIGVRGKPGSPQSKMNLDRVSFQKVAELVSRGHQVMVFVHARKETVKTALALKELAMAEGSIDEFSCETTPQWSLFRRQIGESRNKEMKQLFDSGFGIHHAGMLRTDRNMMERVFRERAIKVLVCTATLAWGVNLPAHAVIIKGTQIYDSAKGKFVDLSVLDVLQIFGRAGRPGLEDSGEGYICTTEDKLQHYLDAITSQVPIESRFQAGLADALNAEIALGTVTSVADAVTWLRYTYLFVRMRKNPFTYGISGDELLADPQLVQRRNDIVASTVRQLTEAAMVSTGTSSTLSVTDLGRIAARYYISSKTIEHFNEKFRSAMTEADVLSVLSGSSEFGQIQVRESEIKELEQFLERIPCQVERQQQTEQSRRRDTTSGKGGIDTTALKVNILLQAYISRLQVEDFALVSDTLYVSDNGGRIARALLEIAISKRWADTAAVCIGLSKAIEKRLWPYQHPLLQIDLKQEVHYGLETWCNDWSIAELAASSAQELGELVHLNKNHGKALLTAAQQFPRIGLDYQLRPLASDVLKIVVTISPAFEWNSRYHGASEPFWLWVEDEDGMAIIQMVHLLLRQGIPSITTNFLISVPDRLHPQHLTIRYFSDRWLGAEDELPISFDPLSMPPRFQTHTTMLNIHLLAPSVLNDELIEAMLARSIHAFNPMQSQVLWPLIHTRNNLLLCAPAGSGSSLLAKALIWKHVRAGGQVLVVVPRKSFAKAAMSDLHPDVFGPVEFAFGSKVWQRSKGNTVHFMLARDLYETLCNRDPNTLLSHSIDLIILDHLEELDATYEMAIALLLRVTQLHDTRLVAFSRSLSDPGDVASWLDIDPAWLFSFKPTDRNQALTTQVHTIFTGPTATASISAMINPTDTAIQTESQAVVFVPTRGLCHSTALKLITQRTLRSDSARGYLPADIGDPRVNEILHRLRDKSLTDLVAKGVGLFHAGLQASDRMLMIELFVEGFIRVIVSPHDSCFALPVRAPLVVVMGTQWVDTSRQVRDYELTELVHMQSLCALHSGAGRFLIICHSDQKDSILHFLSEGLPLESRLLETPDLLLSWVRYQQQHGYLPNQKQDLADALSFTFLSHRIAFNPVYYDCSMQNRDENLSRIIDKLTRSA